MTNRDIITFYLISLASGAIAWTQIHPIAGLITFVGVSWLQTHEREHRRNP